MVEWIKQYWLAVLFGGITGAIMFIFKKGYLMLSKKYKTLISDIEREKTEQDSIKEGLLALLHDRLTQSCQYHMKKRYITIEELDNLKYLYKSYSVLGGNGTVTELYNRCMKLSISTEKDANRILDLEGE